jgi:N-ethylmaleimide reductase
MTQDTLFTPYILGDVRLANRIVMAPLTRNRAAAGFVPGPHAAEYYAQRASAGLLIAEATQVSQQGQGYQDTPGIYSDAQVAGWRIVTDAVHVGRVSHVDLQPDGAAPVAPSAIRADTKTFIHNSFVDTSEPRALELAELPGIVADFRKAAANAIAAGFDGVEIHAGNGYLLDQFAKDGSNHRTDAYGGSVENRARLILEVAAAVSDEIGAGRTGIRLSPVSPFNGVATSDPQSQFDYIAGGLDKLGLGFIHVIEGATGGPRDVAPFDYEALRRAFGNTYIANNGYDLTLATDRLTEDKADLFAFGRLFIANPDLVARLKSGAPLAEINPATLYGGGAEGYTDYPALK